MANDSLSTANVDSESSLWAAAIAVGLLYVCVCVYCHCCAL